MILEVLLIFVSLSQFSFLFFSLFSSMSHSPNSLAPLIHDYHSLELQAHVSIDDVIAKVSEELYELEQAIAADDAIEISSEAQDVLTNIVSVSARLVDMSDLPIIENRSDGSI